MEAPLKIKKKKKIQKKYKKQKTKNHQPKKKKKGKNTEAGSYSKRNHPTGEGTDKWSLSSPRLFPHFLPMIAHEFTMLRISVAKKQKQKQKRWGE